MKQKLLLLLLSTFAAISANARDFTYFYKNQYLNFRVIDEEKRTCETTWADASGIVEIPSVAKDRDDIEYTVVAIGEYSFRGSFMDITSVVIPNTVTIIGNNAFEDSSLTSIIIPNSVSTIGYQAFYRSKLSSVKIPNSVTSIGEEAFSECQLKSVEIPNSITIISKGSFSGNSELTSVVIPNSVTTIGESAFYNCDKLSSISIPNAVESIEENAFGSCKSLVSIEIPASIIEIGRGAFSFCNNLRSFSVAKDNPKFTSSNGVIYSKNMDTLILVPGGTTSIDIPNSVTSIADYASEDCMNLTSVNIPESVQHIGMGAFAVCTNLTSIVIPNSVTTIGEFAFSTCLALESVTLPSNLTEFRRAFAWSPNIRKVIYPTDEPCEGSYYDFEEEVYDNAELIIPAYKEGEFRSVIPWCLFKNIKGTAGLDNIATDDTDTPSEVYTLGGVKIGNSTEGLLPGVYIVRKGSTTEKIIVTQ